MGHAEDRRRGDPERNAWRGPAAVIALAVLGVIGGAAALSLTGGGPAAAPSFANSPAIASGSGVVAGSPGATTGATAKPGNTGDPGTSTRPSASDAPVGVGLMPMVPVVSFWSTHTDVTSADLEAAIGGYGPASRDVVVPADDAAAIAAALHVSIVGSVRRLASPGKVKAAVRDGALGLLRASDIDPSVRALSLDGKALFGETRLDDAGQWPLMVPVGASADQTWSQSTTWTMLAGGDMFMDRGVYRAVVQAGKGLDWPFDGGTAEVTGHHCCGVYVTTHEIPDVRFTGDAGAIRELVRNADLAVANLETPVPDNWVYHAHGYVFSSDPSLLPMFTHAGIDFVTIANNHIRNFGAQGIADTRKNLAAVGLKFAGAGANLAEAGQIAYLAANGTQVAIIGCQGVATSDYATASKAGTLPCTEAAVVPRIREAKKRAELVIVFAHWGKEEDNNPQPGQEPLAKAWITAGAGLILGAHTHVPGAIQEIDGTVVFYSLGNFIFDQSFWTKEMESFLPELTFQGNRLVQIRMHPYVSPGEQPNLLNPATDDGKAIMDTVRQASAAVGLKW